MTKTTHSISLSIPIELLIELEEYCKKDERSKAYVATKAIKEFLNKKKDNK